MLTFFHYFFFLINLLPLLTLAQEAEEFRNNYPDEYEQAIRWTKINKKLIVKELGREEAPLIFSIAFPEVLRYDALNHFLEMQSMELSYVQGGSKKLDFSVGIFQIKVSFVENLEQNIDKFFLEDELRNYLSLKDLSTSEARKTRLDRLKTTEGQLRYLRIFYQYLSHRFAETFSNLSSPEKLNLLATAYNSGAHNSLKTLQKRQKQHIFPDGYSSNKKQYNYGKIAVDFYVREAHKIFQD